MSLDKQKVQELLKLTKTIKLLYVEDNAHAREQTLKVLKNFFDKIDIAIDGKVGLLKYQNDTYDLIITDINMPNLDGLQMSKEILKQNPSQHIIVLSAYNDSDNLQECIELGITNFLHKPVDLEKIVNTLEKTVRDIVEKKKVNQLNSQISDLLNHAKEGYLSFNQDLKCNSGYSQKCLEIFEKNDIEGDDISELLFENSPQNKEIFLKAIKSIYETDDELQKELFISLLPSEQEINGKIIQLTYESLDEKNFMVILKDISEQKKLEKKLKEQERIKNMLLSIATDKEAFLELVGEFEEFLQKPPTSPDKLLRDLHTFKGNFAQQEMIHIVKALHECENQIKSTKELTVEQITKLSQSLQKDLNIIRKNFNSDFLKEEKTLYVKESDLENIEQKVSSLPVSDEKFQQKIEEILFYLNRFRYIPLKRLLTPYQKYLKDLSEKLEKPIYPLELPDDNKTVVPKSFKPFTRSLVHLFSNALAHGIEDAETRVALGKDPIGTISCHFQQIQNSILLDISDNGQGIDTDKLVERVVKNGLKTKEECEKMSEQEKLELIFLDGVSTSDDIDLLKGRGVGMSAILEELNKLDGKVFITSKKNRGSQFEFFLPIEMECFKSLEDKDIILDSISTQLFTFLSEASPYKLRAKKEINSTQPLKSYNHVKISLEKDEGYDECILSLPQSLIRDLKKIFMIEESDAIDKDEILKETTNIVIGLAISNFPENYKNINISTPSVLSQESFEEEVKNSKEFAIFELDSNQGSFYCTILQTKKEKEAIC